MDDYRKKYASYEYEKRLLKEAGLSDRILMEGSTSLYDGNDAKILTDMASNLNSTVKNISQNMLSPRAENGPASRMLNSENTE